MGEGITPNQWQFAGLSIFKFHKLPETTQIPDTLTKEQGCVLYTLTLCHSTIQCSQFIYIIMQSEPYYNDMYNKIRYYIYLSERRHR